jgi:phosphoribosylanthranilate isomerase
LNLELTDADSAEPGPAAGAHRVPCAAGARTRVKVCGLTRPEDALAAARFGADAVGLIFYPRSPRVVDIERARTVRNALPPFVTVVGVFVDQQAELVERALAEVPLDLVQFHGAEPPEFCQSFRRPYLKAVRVRPGVDLHQVARRYSSARALMLDSFEPGKHGGTGKTFDWSLIPADLELPFILAGGLTPENVADAVAAVSPFAVDANGGVEASPGIKDPVKIEAFIREVNRGQNSK